MYKMKALLGLLSFIVTHFHLLSKSALNIICTVFNIYALYFLSVAPAIITLLVLFSLLKDTIDESDLEGKRSELKNNIFIVVITISITVILNLYNYFKNNHLFWTVLLAVAALTICGWYYTFYAGRKILMEINPKKENIFLGNAIESVFGSSSSLAVIILITSFFFNPEKSSTSEQVINSTFLILFLLMPIIKMYNFLLSEYYEYDKQHSEVNETEVLNKQTNGENKGKTQYNDVERFIDMLESIDDLSNLEKSINKKIKKLEKEKFAGVRRYVEKSATLKDLNSLEKIIAEKRDELENNNDTEKHMD